MRFFSLFAVVLPAIVLAVPGPSANSDTFAEAVADAISRRAPETLPIARAASDTELAALIEARQLDLSNLSGLLSNLTASFGAISQLLSPSSLDNINTVVSQLAYTLKGDSAGQLKDLVSTADGLLKSDAVTGLLNALGSDAVKGLIDSLPSLLSSITGLLTKDTIKEITDILSNAHELLTADFVKNTKGLINDIAPLVSAIAQVISALLSAVFGTS